MQRQVRRSPRHRPTPAWLVMAMGPKRVEAMVLTGSFVSAAMFASTKGASAELALVFLFRCYR